MKGTLLGLCLLLNLVLKTHGQLFLKGGMAISNVNFTPGNEYQSFKPVKGVVAGMGYNFETKSKAISIQTEMLFTQRGSLDIYHSTFPAGYYREEKDASINYFELPVLIRCSGGNKHFKAYMSSGLSISAGLGGKYIYTETIDQTQVPYSKVVLKGEVKFGIAPANNQTDLYVDNRTLAGWQFGAGFILGSVLMLDFRYEIGLSNLYNFDSSSPNSNPQSKYRSLQLSVGLLIPKEEQGKSASTP